jgi:hypothetical protein
MVGVPISLIVFLSIIEGAETVGGEENFFGKASSSIISDRVDVILERRVSKMEERFTDGPRGWFFVTKAI